MKKVNEILNKLQNLKKEASQFANMNNPKIKKLKLAIQNLMKQAEKDLNKVDLKKVISNLRKEKVTIETYLDKTLKEEINKTKRFVNEQKKELDKLQKVFETYLTQAKKSAEKEIKKQTSKIKGKQTKKTTKKKSVSKKVVKKTATTSSKKKVTKKVAKKTKKKASKKSTKK